ncbi:WXG100 family type VII secretion target [Nonomuraea sp. NPDC048826]|uniref:WXG100 family type VII secretion target n=1 Tax=Nonomuraea sp. NPDC048826 TaxID=3364347 RepID=UPI0037106533
MSFFKEVYWTAAGTATAAAFMIGQPWAFYVASGIGTMISDPEGMTESAQHWRTADRNGATTELDDLTTQLASLKTQLKDQGTWEGEAFTAFDEIHTSYTESVKQLKEIRNATGDAVDSSATFYKWGAVFCQTIALGMMALGIAKMIAKASPVSAVIAEGVAATFGKITLTAVKQVLWKQRWVAGGLGIALYTAVNMSEAAGKVFPTLKAIPTEMSMMEGGKLKPFMNDGMTYDENTGALLPKVDDSLAQI